MMNPPMQPTLEDDRVLIRPLTAEDWDALYAVASNPLIWELHPAHDRWQEPVFRAYFAEGLASNGAVTIVDKASGDVIGSSRYDRRVCLDGEVEIGWTFLLRAHWGGETNRSIKRLMIDHAFKRYQTAIFLVGDTNLRSRRAMEKIGGVLTDRTYPAEMAGREIVHLIYAISEADFRRGPLA